MDFDHPRFSAVAIGALAVFLVYRRLRASFGPQRVRPARMAIRIALLLAVAAFLLPLAHSLQFLLMQSAGATVGAALGAWGARRTRYRREGDGLYYQPHAYAGMAISALVIGRLVYRAVEWYSAPLARTGLDPALDPSAAGPAAQMAQSPLTVGLLFVLVGYYACYYGAVLWKAGRISPEDLEVEDTPIAAATQAGDALPADSNRL